MFRLFETIRITNGIPLHLSWHERRMNRARNEIWKLTEPVILAPRILVPDSLSAGIVRCNIEYGPDIQAIHFMQYKKRKIASLKLIISNSADYHVKYRDRTLLESLLERRGDCDEIIIVKDGLITDTSMSNLIFFDGISWFTPSTPLLAGTCRDRLLAEGKIEERPIRLSDLNIYQGIKLINALRDPDEEEFIPISNIYR